MKLFGFILLAGLLSLIVGIGVTIALNAIAPCYSDKAGCGMSEAYRLFFVPGFALLGVVAFGISAAGKNRERPLWLTLMTLCLVPVFLFLFAVGADVSSGRTTSKGDLSDSLLAALAFWSVVLVQWRVIRDFLRRRE
ncbi:MAG: hypothetical protein V4661_03155 [Pseudomonadota bacterium]